MSRRTVLFLPVVFLSLSGFLASAVPAQAQQSSSLIVKAVNAAADKQAQELQLYFEKLNNILKEQAAKGDNQELGEGLDTDEMQRETGIDMNLQQSLQGVPRSSAMTSMLITSALEGRYRELQWISPTTGGAALGRGLFDSTKDVLTGDSDNYNLYIKYFCDPLALQGQMGQIKTDVGKCGGERISVLGDPGANIYANTDVARENLQVVGMPLKPNLLFFEPSTFPSIPDGAAAGMPNTNKMADLIYAGYRYFERLAFGPPAAAPSVPDLKDGTAIEAYLTNQGRVAKQMLTSYPFAVLFAERIGTLINQTSTTGGKETTLSPPKAAAELLRSSYAGATIDPTILKYIQQLENQPTMSMAQYLDIVAYKVPMSPGYLTRIATLTPEQLMREKVYLMGLQSVLKYQINRWMEISTAMEAVAK